MMILKKELVCMVRKSDLGTTFGKTSISFATTEIDLLLYKTCLTDIKSETLRRC